jgi:4-hydroxy-tetrahydrodipicolinate synthase
VARLAEIPNIVAIKEATADLRQASRIIELCGEAITVISGDDFTVLPLLAIGGKGVISVVSNIAPALMARLVDAFADGDLTTARQAHYRLFPLAEAMFIETNPIPVKTALGLMGKIAPEFRLPLCPMGQKNRERLEAALQAAGLIGG